RGGAGSDRHPPDRRDVVGATPSAVAPTALGRATSAVVYGPPSACMQVARKRRELRLQASELAFERGQRAFGVLEGPAAAEQVELLGDVSCGGSGHGGQ